MFDFLSEKFSSIFSRITGKNHLTQDNIDETVQKVQDALIGADVPYELVQTFCETLKAEAVGQKVTSSMKPAEQFIKMVHEKLKNFLGGANAVEFSFQLPSVVMVMGLQGSGKTTSIAKMARFVQKQAEKRGKKRRILVASVDFYRPAAVDQLEVLAKQVNVDFYRSSETDPVRAAADIYKQYQNERYELLFLDTAGRLHVDNTLLQELQSIDSHVQPRYKFLVLDAMTGQESLNVAKAFEQAIGFHASTLTKMDSDTRGGAAFSFRYALKKPITFIGTGEKPEDLELFYPERIAGRILGMGDIQSLLERADEKIQKSEQDAMQQSLMKGKMSLKDFANQMNMVGRLGSMQQLMKYMPGARNMNISDEMIEKGELELKKFKAIISSMTEKEQVYPKILDSSRKNRIARGAGATVTDINQLLQRFEQSQQYVKLFKKMGRFSGKFPRM